MVVNRKFFESAEMTITFSDDVKSIGELDRTKKGGVVKQVELKNREFKFPLGAGDGRLFRIRDPSYTPPRAASKIPPPPKKEPKRAPRTPPRQPRPKTPEELARRLWSSANNYLANGAVKLATRKLEEIVKKYPDTKYGPMAKNKLRSLQ